MGTAFEHYRVHAGPGGVDAVLLQVVQSLLLVVSVGRARSILCKPFCFRAITSSGIDVNVEVIISTVHVVSVVRGVAPVVVLLLVMLLMVGVLMGVRVRRRTSRECRLNSLSERCVLPELLLVAVSS